ncbi:MAG TPA: polyphosphate kinase 2 family protein [Bryobacteraceae bacterium]|nr:polyphosphate kinase 2 family protein [Bryobacteraceae bacterium]
MSNLPTELIQPEAGVDSTEIDADFDSVLLDLRDDEPAQPAKAGHLPLVDLYKEFVVEPGTRVHLGEIEPGYCAGYESRESAQPRLQLLLRKLDRLQYLMYAEKKHSLLIVFQGLDACGKDGVIRHILNGMNPAGCRLVGFKYPKPEELAHDFLWRIHPHLPAKGETSIFNRSHYEDVLVVRVHQFMQASTWAKRYELINDFEKLLSTENNTTVLKFFLYISKDEQLARFRQRLEDPSRHWKISEADYKERVHWNRYTEAFEDMFHRTSTRFAPWFVIPSNHKWFRDLAVSEIVTRTLEGLDMKLPEPAVNIADIFRRYHAAEELSEPL